MDLGQGSASTSVSMVGREAELRNLMGVVDAAVRGSPRLVLVRGEAGVGKTTLVRAAADRAHVLGFEVLWGTGLRLVADDAPYVTLAMAFQRRLGDSDGGAGLRDAVGDVPGAGWLVPEGARELATSAAGTAASSISAAGALLFRLSARAPVLLVVDDVQWADTATRDVLAYVVAGFAGQRLAVITVQREEQATPLEAFGLWLADMRRMPEVQEVEVRRLTRDLSDAQVVSVLGSDASPQFLEDVFRSSQGNPYLTVLLLSDLRGGRPVPDSLPPELPSALADALLAAWARLGAAAQELSRALAVGGAPVVVADLESMPLLDAAYAHAIMNGRGTFESGVLADAHLVLGDLRASQDVLRDALARRGRPKVTAWARLTAAALAARRGDPDAARQHRLRALEVMPNLEHRAGGFGSGYLAELALAEGDPTSAIRVVVDAIPNIRRDSPYVDELCLWGARAAADLATLAVDRRDKDALEEARAGFASLLEARATAAGEPFAARSVDDLVSPAVGALFAAERQRLLGCAGEGRERVDASEKTAECWRRAAELCARAGLRWDQHHALSQLGAVLVTSAGATPEARQALRSAHAYAVEQGAVVLRQAVEATAALGRISLTPTRLVGNTPPDSSSRVGALGQLTARERDVLSHLVAHRTNAEIASDLFISDKTVSVHVSNMLRKTETSSRRELAALAVRLGWGRESRP